MLLVVEQPMANFTPGQNLAGEPRDHPRSSREAARRLCPMQSMCASCSISARCFAPRRWRRYGCCGTVDPLCQRSRPVRAADSQVSGNPAAICAARRTGGCVGRR
jgi:hypothetical protein